MKDIWVPSLIHLTFMHSSGEQFRLFRILHTHDITPIAYCYQCITDFGNVLIPRCFSFIDSTNECFE
jgi:hypothetical protein